MNLLQIMFLPMPSGGGSVSLRGAFVVMLLAFVFFALPSLIVALTRYIKHKRKYPTLHFNFIDDIGFLPSSILFVYSLFAVGLSFAWICTLIINYLN